MTQSMTGFARGSVTTDSAAVTVEVRSVNNRFLDLHFRMPDSVRALEPTLREGVSKLIARGKVEVHIKVQETQALSAIAVNQARLNSWVSALEQVTQALPSSTAPDPMALLMAPGVLESAEADTEALSKAVLAAHTEALHGLVEQRLREGAQLAGLVAGRAATMRAQLAALRLQLPALRDVQRQRILDRIADAGVSADGKRLEEELVYVAQRADVDEEMDRIDAHLDAIEQALAGKAPCGRRLDFLMQELNREANTLSSKSNALTTTNTAVEFKLLIEQMREQIQNIE
mgnify:CR=1 FL=1